MLGAGQPIGFILGLVLGGILTQSRATWRAIFYFQAGLGVLFTALGWLALGEEKAEKKYTKGLDWGGALLSTAGVALLTYSLAYVPPLPLFLPFDLNDVRPILRPARSVAAIESI